MKLHAVGRLVAHLHVAALHLLGPRGEVHKLLTARTAVSAQTGGARVLFGVNRIECVKGLGVDRVTRHMLTPIVKRHPPRVGAVVGAKAGELVEARLEAKPTAVLLAHRAIRRLNLAMVENGFTENQIAVRAPHKIMQRMVTVLAAESGEHQLAVIGLAVAIGILDETHVRLLTHVYAAITKLKRQRNVQVIGKHRGLVRAPVAIGILQNHQLIVRLIAGVHVRIGRRAAHPHAPLAVPAHLDGARDFRKLLLAREEIHLKSRIDLKRLQLIGWAHPFIGPATCCRGRQRRDVGIINLRRHRFALRQIPNAPVAVLHHDVEVAHRRQEIQITVAAIAAARVIKRVHRTVPPKELLVLFDHRRAHCLVRRR